MAEKQENKAEGRSKPRGIHYFLFIAFVVGLTCCEPNPFGGYQGCGTLVKCSPAAGDAMDTAGNACSSMAGCLNSNIGVLLAVIGVLLFLLWHRRR